MNNSIYCQTEQIEVNNIFKRFELGEITEEEFKQYAKSWRVLIDDLGGYPNLPYDSVKNSISYKKIFDVELSKKIIFDRVLEWAAISFGSLDHVLNYKDFETGKIILKGNFDVTYLKDVRNFWGNSKEALTQTTCYQTYVFTVKENKLKIEILNIRYKFYYFGYYNSSIYIPERTLEISIHDLYPITNFESDQWKENLDLLKQTNSIINKLTEGLSLYIKSYNQDYGY
jgi:hypothetical protein